MMKNPQQFVGGTLLEARSDGGVCVRAAILRSYRPGDALFSLGAVSDARREAVGEPKWLELAGSLLSSTSKFFMLGEIGRTNG
jgi:hypothetical protein